jgi:hydrogenase expression/formation protein HypC
MCLAVPGKITRWISRDPVLATAEVEFSGVKRVCHMACVIEAVEGDYVIVHAGVGISRIDAAEAQRVFEELQLSGDPDHEWQESGP